MLMLDLITQNNIIVISKLAEKENGNARRMKRANRIGIDETIFL